MARQERAVDPTAGPLQSFAFELRKVRLEAGNPTYRALSKLAGFSPTTLSEAASGVRKPSLDVVLAYVGACQGNVEAWRERWYELDAALGGDTPRDEPNLEPEIYQPPPSAYERDEWLSELRDQSEQPTIRRGQWPPDSNEEPTAWPPSPGSPAPGEQSTARHGAWSPSPDEQSPAWSQDPGEQSPAGYGAWSPSPDEQSPAWSQGPSEQPTYEQPTSGGRGTWQPDLGDPSAVGRNEWLPNLDEDPPTGGGRRTGAHSADAPEGRRKRGWVIAAIAGGAALLVAVAAVGVVIWKPWESRQAQPAAAKGCPKLPLRSAFTGSTYGKGAPVRSGAAVDDPVLGTISPNCSVGFIGFCLGDKVRDATAGTPDIRWFVLEDGNVVASAVIHGNPPAGQQPIRCRKDRPAPASIALAMSAASGQLKATANGRNLEIVGFSARVPNAASPAATWRQLGLTEGSFNAVLRLEQSVRGQLVIVAAACFGGDAPTTVVDAKAIAADNPGAAPQAANLSAQESAAAAKAACQYPKKG